MRAPPLRPLAHRFDGTFGSRLAAGAGMFVSCREQKGIEGCGVCVSVCVCEKMAARACACAGCCQRNVTVA